MKDQPGVLATDLDGTFIPLNDDPQNISDLKLIQQALHEQKIPLCFVTGRHFESIEIAMKEFHLPEPDWIICDVGTTIRRNNGGAYEILSAYQDHLQQLIAPYPLEDLRKALADFKYVRLQEEEKQGDYKLSFYVEQKKLHEVVTEMEEHLLESDAPYSIIHSVDPFNGDGLIDLLPKSVSKAYALEWWSEAIEFPRDSIIFAGDSGNDLAAMISGFRTIVVGNAAESLVEQVREAHKNQNWRDRFYHSSKSATSGVLDGLLHYGLIEVAE